ncbi:MAG: C-GCAxxG-C-C family protein [Promethearchaeota archaeon]
MTKESLMDRVMQYWEHTQEANCAQSTACSLLDHFGYEKESKILNQAYRVYGGGLSWRLACGTITGNVGALGFIASQKELSKEKTEGIVKEFLSKMQYKYGNLNCKDLMQDWYEDEEINFDLPGRQEKCTDLVQTSVNLSMKLIKRHMC